MSLARAEIVGNVWQILVQDGDEISAGDVIAIMESMKMEIPVLAPESGRLNRLFVKPGNIVQEGDPIAEIVPAAHL